jgi:hypothetical protein
MLNIFCMKFAILITAASKESQAMPYKTIITGLLNAKNRVTGEKG